ncbi:protein ARV1-like isoform X2 [Dysidea avara]|uniref:protein ARV1-like isoform X2 n=1 Tax=Dysidea avara TaxID=196820 RepID=UPI00332CD39C
MPIICVECGEKVGDGKELFREFSGGSLQLTRCDHCGEVLDKYVEMDTVTILVDVLLLRLESYRHLMCNVPLSIPVLLRLTILLLLCAAYLKYILCGIDSNDFEKSQLMFYSMLVVSIAELAVQLAVLNIIVMYMLRAPFISMIVDTYKAVVISSFSKLLAIPAYIWAGDWTSVLPQVLQVVTRFQVFKAMAGTTSGWLPCVIVVVDFVITCLVMFGVDQFCLL